MRRTRRREQVVSRISTGSLTTGGNPYALTMETAQSRGQLMKQMAEAFMHKAAIFSPGTTISNVLYADQENSSKHMLTLAARVPSKLEALSSTRFRSTGRVVISNRYPNHALVLHLQLPYVPENVYLHRGWGYSAIRRVTYTYGASAGSDRRLNREQIKHKLILSSKTREQLDYLIRLGGEEVIAGQDEDYVNNAIIILGIPGSQIYGENYKVPVPVNVFSGSYSIDIEFAPLEEFATGLGLATWNINSFNEAGLYLREFVPEISEAVPSSPQLDPSASILYPFVYSDQTEHALEIDNLGQLNTVALIVPSKGDLVGISLSLLNRIKYAATDLTNPVNPWNYSEIFDYTIRQGSNDLDSSPGLTRLNEMLNTIDGTNGAFQFTASVLWGGYSGEEPAYTYPSRKHLVYWNNAIQRAQLNESVSYNAPDYGQQSLALQFRTDTTGTCILYVVYHYTAYIRFENGMAKLLLAAES